MSRNHRRNVPWALVRALRLVVSAFLAVLGAACVGGGIAFCLFPALGWGAGLIGLFAGLLTGMGVWESTLPVDDL